MEAIETILMMRGIERLVISAGGVAALVMGTLLYRWGVQGRTDVNAEGGGYSFKMVNAAPGGLLGLFGMCILVVSLRSTVSIDSRLWQGIQQDIDTKTLYSAVATKPEVADVSDRDLGGGARAPENQTSDQRSNQGNRGGSQVITTYVTYAYASTSPAVKTFLDGMRGISPEVITNDNALDQLTLYTKDASELAKTEKDPQIKLFLRSVSKMKADDPESAREILLGLPKRVETIDTALKRNR
jgi:hypothetical protein